MGGGREVYRLPYLEPRTKTSTAIPPQPLMLSWRAEEPHVYSTYTTDYHHRKANKMATMTALRAFLKQPSECEAKTKIYSFQFRYFAPRCVSSTEPKVRFTSTQLC